MTVRFYVVPIVISSVGARAPKYFPTKEIQGTPDANPPSTTVMDYGLVPFGLVRGDVTAGEHSALSSKPDVDVIPATLDNNIPSGQIATVRSRLEAKNIPAGWLNSTYTWRQLLRIICGIFQYMQRLTGLSGVSPFDTSATLDTQVSDIPVQWRDWMAQAADELSLDYSAVTGTTTIRQILKGMADQFAGRPFGFSEL